MSTAWLARVPASAAWAHLPWTEFARLSDDESARPLIVQPVHGFADHGLGLPLDAEEVLGSVVLQRALDLPGAPYIRVLPPVRFGLAPYPGTSFGLDPDTAHAQMREIAAGVRGAGFRQLAFFNTSPWNEEFIDTASRDLRADFSLHTYFIHLGALGCDFHPASFTRLAARAATTFVLGRPPGAVDGAGDVRDTDFRPGAYFRPGPPSAGPEPDGGAVVEAAAGHLHRLLREIAARGGARPLADPPTPPTNAPAAPWPPVYRDIHYIPALTPAELTTLAGKADALAIVPTAAIEQHGPHLPVGVDAILGQALLAHALPKLPSGCPVYVTPPLMVGKSNEHAGFPGTLALSASTLRRQLLAMAAQLKSLGFRQMAVLNTHGGNSAVLVYTLREIQVSLGLRAGMLSGYYRPDLSPQEAAYGFHAGEWETSLMLACAPELVRMDLAVCEYPARVDDPGELRPEDAPAVFSWQTRDVSQSGVMGNAPAATPEKGRHWLEEASTALAHRIADLVAPAS